MSPPTVYLITGANRGIGLALVAELCRRGDATVFATVRSPSTASDLQTVAKGSKGTLHIIKLTSGDEADLYAAVKEIEGIASKIDIVIANAAICNSWGPPLDIRAQDMRDHLEINVVANLMLFQKTYPLLQASSRPKFAVISATGGSIETGSPISGILAYGASKAAVNYLTRKIHFEHDDLTCFSLCPGLVDTDMSDFALKRNAGISDQLKMKTKEETATMLLAVIDNATREKDGGTFTSYDGSRIPW